MHIYSFWRKCSLLFFLGLFIVSTDAGIRNNRSRSRRHHFAKTDKVILRGDFDIEGQTAVTADSLPKYNLYFAGTHIMSDESGLYSLEVNKEDKDYLNNLSLIICKRLQPHFAQGTTLRDIEIAKLGKCEWYDLMREQDPKTKKYYWDFEKRENLEPGTTLPANAIVLLLSSARVVGIERTVQTTTGQTDLPRIILKNDMQKLERAATKTAIEAIELRRLTDDQTPQERTQSGVKMSLVS